MNPIAERRRLTPGEFFAGFLSAVAAAGHPSLEGKRSALHRAFHRALNSEAAQGFPGLADFEIGFDPLYGLSPWFDRALTRAQRDLLIDFSNPSYKKINIRIRPEEGMRQIAELGFPGEFERLAAEFLQELNTRK